MKKYTNEELCYLISQAGNNTAKAEYYKRITFNDECLEHKLVLHVPIKKYVNGKLEDVECDKFIEMIIQGLAVTSFYTMQVLGFYNGRAFPEKLVTVFVNNEAAERIDYYFRHAIVKCHLDMQQEAYAYELDDKMHVVSFGKYGNNLRGIINEK